MALKSIYNVIQGPVVSDKAYKLNKDLKKIVLKVHAEANKPLVKEALRKLFNVEVKSVRMLINKGKFRKAGRKIVCGSSQKKAIVTLEEGYSLDLFDQAGTTVVSGERKEDVKSSVK